MRCNRFHRVALVHARLVRAGDDQRMRRLHQQRPSAAEEHGDLTVHLPRDAVRARSTAVGIGRHVTDGTSQRSPGRRPILCDRWTWDPPGGTIRARPDPPRTFPRWPSSRSSSPPASPPGSSLEAACATSSACTCGGGASRWRACAPDRAGASLGRRRRGGGCARRLSYVLLLAFVWVNRRLPAAPLLLLGLTLNLVVIGLNGGMPVSADAAQVGGRPGHAPGRDRRRQTPPDGVVGRAHAPADVIGLPPPLATVLSIGDVLPLRGRGGLLRDRHAGTLRWKSSSSRVDPDVPGEAPAAAASAPPSGSVGISACSSELGNRTVIVAPSFGALCTSNEPPPTWARSRIIAMPK